jgi:peroxiredoxin
MRSATAAARWSLSDSQILDGLLGLPVPSLRLPWTAGGEVDLAALAEQPTIVFVHPGTETLPALERDPDGLLGTGCTVQSRVFAEYEPDFAMHDIRVVGLSSRALAEQLRLIGRERLRFPFVSDEGLALAEAIELPTLATAAGERVYRRLTLFAREGVIEKVFYPVPIPRRDAIDVLSWMGKQGVLL